MNNPVFLTDDWLVKFYQIDFPLFVLFYPEKISLIFIYLLCLME